MAPWTSISPGKPIRLALETPKVGVPRSQRRRERGRWRRVPVSLMTALTAGEFWLGLEKMHLILGDHSSHLAVQLQDWEGNAKSLQFPIRLGGEDTAYSLQLTAPMASELGATITTPSSLSLPFSTWDQDHDLQGDKNCAKSLSGESALSLLVLPARPPSLPFCFPALPSAQFHPLPSFPYLLCDLTSPICSCPTFKIIMNIQ